MVNSHNWEENMSLEVEQLNPVRWKVGAMEIVILVAGLLSLVVVDN